MNEAVRSENSLRQQFAKIWLRFAKSTPHKRESGRPLTPALSLVECRSCR